MPGDVTTRGAWLILIRGHRYANGLRQGFAKRSSPMKPGTVGPSDPLPKSSELSPDRPGHPAKKHREHVHFCPEKRANNSRSSAFHRNGQGNSQSHGVTKAPAFGRRMTRCALLGFEKQLDPRSPLAGHPSWTICSTRMRRPVTQGESKARGIHNPANQPKHKGKRLPALLRNWF